MNSLLLLILTPLLSAISIFFLGGNKYIQNSVVIISSLILLYFVGDIVISDHADISQISYTLLNMGSPINLGFKYEYIGMIFCCLASILWVVASIYSVGYMRFNYPDRDLSVFFSCLSLAIACVMGIALSADLLTLFVFYELLTLSTYPLIIFERSDNSMKAAKYYIKTLMGTSLTFFLVAVIWIFCKSWDLTFVEGGFLSGKLDPIEEIILPLICVYGIAKTAIIPMHGWLPKAMVAPVPVSSLLHAVAVVKAGIFTLIKIVVYVFGLDYLRSIMDFNWLMYMAAITIMFSSILAIFKKNIKAILAYSTISQLSYMILAISMFTERAITAAVLHMIFHGFAKITLFFAAGSIYKKTGKSNVDEIVGLAYSMPYTAFGLIIGIIAMIGLPPTALFWSKFFIIEEAFNLDNYFIIVILLMSSVLNVVYLSPIICNMFRSTGGHIERKESHLSIIIPLLFTAGFSVLMFFIPIVDFIEYLKLKIGG